MSEQKIITKIEVKKVAELARIKISSEEEEKFAKELNSILEFFKDISGVETSGNESFDHYEMKKNQFRKDSVSQLDEEGKKKIREQFPQRKENYLKVKEVLNNSH